MKHFFIESPNMRVSSFLWLPTGLKIEVVWY